jgi:hypothetical protein
MAASEYQLYRLSVTYTSKLRPELAQTIAKLRETLPWTSLPLPTVTRKPRRAWRITYLRSPFGQKIAIRHYIFHDWRYNCTFYFVKNPQEALSTILGSMTKETNCSVDFTWHYPGQEAKPIAASEEDEKLRRRGTLPVPSGTESEAVDLFRGFEGVQRKTELARGQAQGYWQRTRFWNRAMGFYRPPR